MSTPRGGFKSTFGAIDIAKDELCSVHHCGFLEIFAFLEIEAHLKPDSINL
jgi:hypothetical protein